MAPSSALVQVNSKCVLSVRVFINRNRILKSITNPETIFEAPILSNNSIIRLKTPAVRIHLSNDDMASLINEVEDALLFILYELCSPLLEEQVLNKLKVGTFMDFSNVLDILSKDSKLPSKSKDQYNPIDGILTQITTIQRIGKKKYKLHFSHNWKLDIVIENVEKLSHWQKLLTLLDSMQAVTSCADVPLFVPFKNTNVLLRTIQPIDKSESESNPILLESDDEHTVMPLDDLSDSNLDLESTAGEDKKQSFDYRYRGMRLFDKCVSIHILERPKRHK